MGVENGNETRPVEQRAEQSHPPRRRRLSWTEWLLAAALVTLLCLLGLPTVRAAVDAREQASCAANLKQLGIAFKMFAGESRHGQWPPVSPVRGNWVPDMSALHPDYCADVDQFICPGHPDAGRHRFQRKGPSGEREPHPDCVTSRYYVYTGFVMGDDYDAIAVHDALLSDWANLRNTDLLSPLPYALDMLGGPSASGVVMWDRLSLDTRRVVHRPLGANVLFMDGHVEFQPFEPGAKHPTFPVTAVSAELFAPLPDQLPPGCTD